MEFINILRLLLNPVVHVVGALLGVHESFCVITFLFNLFFLCYSSYGLNIRTNDSLCLSLLHFVHVHGDVVDHAGLFVAFGSLVACVF